MGAALNDSQLQAITQRLSTDPAMLRAFQANRAAQAHNKEAAVRNHYMVRGGNADRPVTSDDPRQAVQSLSDQEFFKRQGIDFPDAEDYGVTVDKDTGQMSLQRAGYWNRNSDWLIPAIAAGAVVTGGMILPAVLGGAAAGGGTVAATGGAAIPTTTGISSATALGLPVTAAPVSGLTTAAAIPTVSGLTGAELGAGVTGADFAANAISPGADTATLASRQTVPNAGTLPTGTSPQGSGVGHDPTSYESILKQLLGNSANNNGIDWTSLALGGIGSALNAWAATQAGPQKRQSFRGTTADPVDILSGATKAIGSEAHTLNDLQAQPPELTGPGPQSLPTFTGGGMPMPIGVRRNLTPPLGTHPLSSQPATSDELDHLYSSLSMLGGKR